MAIMWYNTSSNMEAIRTETGLCRRLEVDVVFIYVVVMRTCFTSVAVATTMA